MPAPLKCPIGRRSGELVLLGDADSRQAATRTRRQWRARCSCGAECLVSVASFNAGRVTCCPDCGRKKRLAATTKHGLGGLESRPPEYTVWLGMRRRCNDPNEKSYHRYGGRGIKLCARWDDFALFFADMGPRPSSGHSIERKDNDVGYQPGNCVWATAKEQAQNRRSNKLITFGGRTMPVSAWAEETGIPLGVVLGRLRKGHSLKTALTEPVHRKGEVLDAAIDGRKRGRIGQR